MENVGLVLRFSFDHSTFWICVFQLLKIYKGAMLKGSFKSKLIHIEQGLV